MGIKGLEKIREHVTLEYHMTATTKMQEFKSAYENPSRAIDTIFDKESGFMTIKLLLSLF